MTSVERFSEGLRGGLRPYYCEAKNKHTGRACHTVLIDAWSPAGAVVRRRCRRCGSWATIVVAPDAPGSDTESPVLD